jgi:hypothetical protein
MKVIKTKSIPPKPIYVEPSELAVGGIYLYRYGSAPGSATVVGLVIRGSSYSGLDAKNKYFVPLHVTESQDQVSVAWRISDHTTGTYELYRNEITISN